MASFRRGLLEREHGQLAHKERQGFAVCRCEQLQLNDIDAPLTRFTLRNKRLRNPHFHSRLNLRQSGASTSFTKFSDELTIFPLVLGALQGSASHEC